MLHLPYVFTSQLETFVHLSKHFREVQLPKADQHLPASRGWVDCSERLQKYSIARLCWQLTLSCAFVEINQAVHLKGGVSVYADHTFTKLKST